MNFGADPASADIAPEAVYDDGLFTVIRFRPGSDIPAVYQVTGEDPRKDEALLKTHVDPATGALVVEKVVREMRLRARSAVVGIYNEGYGSLTRDPFVRGTSVPGVKRTFAPDAQEASDGADRGRDSREKDGSEPVKGQAVPLGGDDRQGGEP
jgi:type IV secretion system protein VirB9